MAIRSTAVVKKSAPERGAKCGAHVSWRGDVFRVVALLHDHGGSDAQRGPQRSMTAPTIPAT